MLDKPEYQHWKYNIIHAKNHSVRISELVSEHHTSSIADDFQQLLQPNCPDWLRVLVHNYRAGKEIVCKAECSHRHDCPLELKRRNDIYQSPIAYCKVLQIFDEV